MSNIYDLIIVGGGPAGLTAGLYASRAKLDCILFEKGMPGGQMAVSGDIENYPGFDLINGIELCEKMENHVRRFGLDIRMDEIIRIFMEDSIWEIETISGDKLKAKTVIACPGGYPRKVGIKGEAELSGRGVSYCAICDGAFYKEKKVYVLGGGDSAVEEGVYLTRFAASVTIVHRRDTLRAQKILQDAAFSNSKVSFIWNTIPMEIKGEKRVEAILLKNVKTNEENLHKTDGVFIYIGFLPNNSIFTDDIKKDDGGFIIVDSLMATNLPGLFACGDIISKPIRQIANAVGEGAVAEFSAEKYLEHLKTK